MGIEGMARGRPKKAGKRKAAVQTRDSVKPTAERTNHNLFQSAGMANKVVPPIDTLLTKGTINQRQADALRRYGDVATAAERSEIKCNIDFSVYETGEGLPHFGVRMNIELGYLERELGSLRDIAHAVCVMEKPLTTWAMEQGGSIARDRSGVVYFEPTKHAMKIATVDIRTAGDRLASALDFSGGIR